MDKVQIRLAAKEDWPRIKASYRAWDYQVEVTESAVVFIAEDHGQLVGVVRLERENDETVLRGMRVAEPRRRQGIGKAILDLVDRHLENTRCFCIAYTHLNGFYGRIGFKEIRPENAPRFLQDRARYYRELCHDIMIMVRGAEGL